jgi:acyl-CoA synthetase (AMP-forming)/AMP-acid ligase II
MPVPDRPVTGDHRVLLDVFDAVLAVAPDAEAFVHPQADGTTRRLSFEQWATEADALAGWLADEAGVRQGDVVAIELPSGIDYAIAYQAILRAGGVATGVNTRLGPTEVAHIHARSEPRHTFRGSLPDVGVGAGDPLRRRVRLEPTDPVAIVWTGGTTGMPKGAWFDHACLQAMTLGAAPLSAVGDRRLSPLPFAHVGAMTRVWDELMHVITTVIAPTPWTAVDTLALLSAERVTVCQGVPTQYRMLLDVLREQPKCDRVDLSSLRLAGTGAARIPPELVVEIREQFGCPVVARYASTESCIATGTRLDDDLETVCTTVGRPNGDVELRIVDDHGAPVAGTGPEHVGTVCLRSRAMMRGYWREPERTAEVIDADGWLHTGDLGWLGDDGNLRLVGRSTEMYIRGGYNVYPIEVENCLGAHPGVTAAAVVGATVADRLGEIGVLFAVPAPGEHLDLDELRAFVKERLADYKAPDVLVLVDSLPLTSIGKVDKKALAPIAKEEAARWTR